MVLWPMLENAFRLRVHLTGAMWIQSSETAKQNTRNNWLYSRQYKYNTFTIFLPSNADCGIDFARRGRMDRGRTKKISIVHAPHRLLFGRTHGTASTRNKASTILIRRAMIRHCREKHVVPCGVDSTRRALCETCCISIDTPDECVGALQLRQ